MGKLREQHKILIVGLPPGSTSADLTKLVMEETGIATLKELAHHDEEKKADADAAKAAAAKKKKGGGGKKKKTVGITFQQSLESLMTKLRATYAGIDGDVLATHQQYGGRPDKAGCYK